MTIERNDLNLFRVFHAIMEHRSLTAAGRALGIGPSAVSHALGRLRTLMGDELFVAGARAMVPTPHATSLAPRVATALDTLGEVLSGREFLPVSAERLFRIGMSGSTGMVLLPGLLERVLRLAPHVRLRIVPIGRLDLVEQLDEGRLDLVVTWFDTVPERIRRQELFVEQEAIVVRQGHRLAQGEPSKAALLSFPHLVMEFTGTDDLRMDGFHNERGLHRRIWIERLLLEDVLRDKAERMTVITVPEPVMVAPLLRCTDLVATLPLRVARLAMAEGGLATVRLPYQPLNVHIEAAWHERSGRDAALQWLVGQIAEVGRELGPVPGEAPGSLPP